MAKRFELLPGERIIRDEPIHWKNYLTSLLSIALCFFLLLVRIHLKDVNLVNRNLKTSVMPDYTTKIFFWLEVTVLSVIMFLSFLRTVDISYIHYYVTDKRIISITGVINRHFSEMLLSKCEMVYLTQNAYERMYNCGDILCVSAGASLFLDDVRNAVAFKQQLMTLLSEQKSRYND